MLICLHRHLVQLHHVCLEEALYEIGLGMTSSLRNGAVIQELRVVASALDNKISESCLGDLVQEPLWPLLLDVVSVELAQHLCKLLLIAFERDYLEELNYVDAATSKN